MSRALNYHLQSEAQALVALARLNGTLSRPEACEACGKPNNRSGPSRCVWHHYDYAEPLDLIGLCRPCHGRVHAGSIPEPRTGRVYPKRTRLLKPKTARREPSRFWSEFRRTRTSAGLSQQGLAERLGVNKAVVSRWEGGHRIMKHAHFVAACDLFGWAGKRKDAMEAMKLEGDAALQGGTP